MTDSPANDRCTNSPEFSRVAKILQSHKILSSTPGFTWLARFSSDYPSIQCKIIHKTLNHIENHWQWYKATWPWTATKRLTLPLRQCKWLAKHTYHTTILQQSACPFNFSCWAWALVSWLCKPLCSLWASWKVMVNIGMWRTKYTDIKILLESCDIEWLLLLQFSVELGNCLICCLCFCQKLFL